MIVTVAAASDLDAIAALEADAFEHARWSRAAWASELTGGDRRVLAARSAGDVVGVATFSLVGDTSDLLRVVVHRDHRGRGVARTLVRAGLEWAEALGAGRMMLEVDAVNEAALALYSSLGFAPLARRTDYYAPGVHALVLSRPLGEPTQAVPA